MSEAVLIQQMLGKAAGRRRLERALRGLWIGLLAGSCAWLAIVLTHKLVPIPDEFAAWSWALALAGAGAGFVIGGWQRVSLSTAARVVESRQALEQRLSTALELTGNPAASHSSWNRLVLADAAAAIGGLNIGKLLPLGLPRWIRWIPIVLVLLVGLGFLPEFRSEKYKQRQKDVEVIRDSGKTMAEVVRRDLARREPAPEPIRDAITDVANLGDRLSQARLTKADALQDLKNATQRLQDEARQLEADPVLRKLQQAARTPSGGTGSANSALQKQVDKLRQSTSGAKPDALEKLAQQLQQTRDAANAMQGAQGDPAAQEAFSKSLNQLAQSAKDLGLSLGGLDQAIESMKNLQIDRLLNDLKLAGNDLEKMRDLAKKLAEMQQQMDQLGKDLAEQLDRGQADAAADTLQKMVGQLQDAKLTPEQMQQLLAEVAKALEPAGSYGKVGELLKKAASEMQSGQKNDAAKNLASAAEELRKLAGQAQDLQQLAETLEALEGAQLAIMSGRAWQPGGTCKGGACTGCGLHPNGRIGWKHGGKPGGRGVGTWADENGWLYYPEISERWDNSGVNRPDMASRGHTDRGEGGLNPNVAPTKLQGKFSPGAMPSITLRGVSLKGQSSVQYEEVVNSAQSDAQSALNQDQIPRAYRGAVKGYFDDL